MGAKHFCDYSVSRLQSMYSARTLSLGSLASAIVCSHDNPTAGNPAPSCGMDWIVANEASFLELIRSRSYSVGAFYHTYQLHDQPHAWRILGCLESLMTMSPVALEGFVFRVFMSAPTADESWLQTAVAAGVSEQHLAQLVLAKLQSRPESHDAANDNGATAFMVESFLVRGASNWKIGEQGQLTGLGSYPTYWNILTDSQLTEAVYLCAKRALATVLGGRGAGGEPAVIEKLVANLSSLETFDTLAYRLLSLVRSKQDFELLSEQCILHMPWAALVDAFYAFHGGSFVQACTIVLLCSDPAKASQMLVQFNEPFIGPAGDAEAQRQWREQVVEYYVRMRTRPRRQTTQQIRHQVEARLKAALGRHGYYIAKVEDGEHGGQPELQVNDFDVTYVIDEQASSEDQPIQRPQAGDIVLININDPDSSQVRPMVLAIKMRVLVRAEDDRP